MKNLIVCSLLALSALFAAAPQAHAADRAGVVVSLEPIDNRGADETQTTKKKRAFGRALGNLLGGQMMAHNVGGTVGNHVAAAGGDIGEQVGAKVGDQGPSAHYMVKLKLDEGKTLVITQRADQVQGISVGDRVRVQGSGGSASVYRE